MLQIRINIEKNRLYLTFAGKYDVSDIKKIAEEIFHEIGKLRPGFGVVTNLSDFVPLTEDGRTAMLETMQKMKEMGIGHVVRIVKGGVAGYQWQRTSKTVGYEANEVTSPAEADKLLDSLEKK